MRLILLPISTRRTFMYAQRLKPFNTAPKDRNYIDRGAAWAAKKWAQWERQESGWQRKVVDYGNHALRRIPFEEWALKSIPPLSAHRREGERRGQEKIELVFPGKVIAIEKVEQLAFKLATERQSLHRKKMIWCIVGMPITIPFALIPIIPNLPFFYLVYRAWSHWRAISGGKHVQWLVENKLLAPSPYPALDEVYAGTPSLAISNGGAGDSKEEMLLASKQIPVVSQVLDASAIEVELERALRQVEKALEEHEGKITEDSKSTSRDETEGPPIDQPTTGPSPHDKGRR